MPSNFNTFLSAAKRSDLIDQYMECWYDTESYSTDEKADEEASEIREYLSSLPNPQLYKEIKETGWGIIPS